MKFRLNLRYDLQALDDVTLADQLAVVEELRAALETKKKWHDFLVIDAFSRFRSPVRHLAFYRFLVLSGIFHGELIAVSALAALLPGSASTVAFLARHDRGMNRFLLDHELLDLQDEIESRLSLRGRRV